jgi:hypothetical protein
MLVELKGQDAAAGGCRGGATEVGEVWSMN